MNLTYTRPGELRKPDIEVLPDGRIRITRYIAAGHGDRDYSEVTEAVGTADLGLATALLVRKGMAQINGKDAIVKTYEVRNASSETLVGLPDIQYTESGQKTMIYDYIQMSSGTYTPGTIGSTSAPDDATCILRTEQVEDDGTTRQIRRVFINKGLLQQSDETRNNGALLLKTFVYLNDAPTPNPPTGYTLVSQRTENPNGLETTTYTYAKGNGEVSRETRYVQSTDQGATGATVITIRHLTASSVTTNPIATPVGTVLISEEKSDQDGYRVWIATYAKGSGTVSSSTDTREDGKLVIYRKAALGVAPTAPTATIGGTVTLISDTSRNDSGYVVYERTWAEGNGEVSRDTRYVQSSDQGTTGATVITVRHLTANSVTTNPVTTPAGTVLISEQKDDQDGYRIWNVTYAKGTGTVASSTDTREGGKLIIYRKTSLGTAPSAPSPTIAGTVTLISDTSRNDSGYVVYERTWAEGIGEIGRDVRYAQSSDQGTTGTTVITVRHITATSVTTNPISTPAGTVLISEAKEDQDGYRAWTAVYAKGTGLVVNDVDIRNSGKLKVYHRVSLGSAPATPTATIGGTVNVVTQNFRKDSGYDIYDYVWAEGIGIVSERIQYRDGGIRLFNRDIFLAQGGTDYSAYTPTYGIEVDKSFTEGEGIRRYSVTWIQSNSGGNPLAVPVLQFVSKVPFTYPGRARAYYAPFTVGSYTSHKAYDVFMSPPVQALIDATTIVYYKATNTAPTPNYTLWNPTEWATMYAKWIGWSNSPRSSVKGLTGYIKVNAGLSGTSSASGTDTSVLGDRVYASTDWSITLSGGPTDPSNFTLTLNIDQVPAFTKTDGTQYYRVTEVYATIPAYPALPTLLP
jgi:hypothetical protein